MPITEGPTPDLRRISYQLLAISYQTWSAIGYWLSAIPRPRRSLGSRRVLSSQQPHAPQDIPICHDIPRAPHVLRASMACGLGLILGLLACFFLAGCANDKSGRRAGPAIALVWPESPAEPRFQYVQSIAMPADVGIKSSTLSRIGRFFTGVSRATDKLNRPFGIALDEAGNLCLTDTGTAQVIFLDRVRKRVFTWAQVGKVQFNSPVAIAKTGTTFFVADSGLGEVLVFDEQGQGLIEVKRELTRPSGLAVFNGQLFVADAPAHCIAVFDLRGNFLFRFGQRGAAPGEFNFPTHISADAQGRLLVTDSMNSRIELFDATGKFLRVLGSTGDSAGHFRRPKGAAVDSAGRIYVADAMSDSLQIFDRAGEFLMDLGQAGSRPGEFWLPNGIAISPDNQIYVTDAYNARVQVFKYIGPP